MNNNNNENDLQIQHQPPLQDRCYPIRPALPNCILLPAANGNNYEIKPHFINMLPKFAGLESEDAYVFISEFEEVCSMMKIQQLSDDAIKLRFVPFALKDNAKKWLYSIPTNSITTWEEFQKAFLKKFYPNHKTARYRNEINQFRQKGGETFWQYFERFKNLLTQCPHHAIEKWRLCQIVYEGLDFATKTMLESMCQGEFMQKNETDAWIFLEDLSDKTTQWDSTHGTSTNEQKEPQKGGIHQIENSIAAEAKIDALRRRIDALETKKSQPEPTLVPVQQVQQQIQQSFCAFYFDPSHVAKQCQFAIIE